MMDIKAMITENTIEFDADLKTREEVLEHISEILVKNNIIKEQQNCLISFFYFQTYRKRRILHT